MVVRNPRAVIVRVAFTLSAVVGALMLLGGWTNGGPLLAPTAVALAFLAAGPVWAARRRYRTHSALRQRFLAQS